MSEASPVPKLHVPELHFGGPEAPRALRDLLERRVEAVEPGGWISFATYYFRDRALAEALIRASDRGVRVAVQVEGRPRCRQANRAVLARLGAHGLGGGLHIHRASPWLPARWRPYLHIKAFAFGGAAPCLLAGSFNPSGDDPEDARIVAQIGDQDRGHNLLAEFGDPVLVDALRRRIASIGAPFARLRAEQNRPLRSGATSLYFYPRLDTAIIGRDLARTRRGDVVEGAVSHMKAGSLADALTKAAQRGVEVRLIVHQTDRRVPEATIARLTGGGAEVSRYAHGDEAPLHAKFIVVKRAVGPCAYFGSFNSNPRSQYVNHELLVRSADAAVADQLSARFAAIAREL